LKRIQRRRTKSWRMPEGAVYVGRPSRWGNPYRIRYDAPIVEECCQWACYEDEGCLCAGCMTPAKAVAVYREEVSTLGRVDEEGTRYDLIDWLLPLRGKDLVCWCPLDQPCHADVLLELANR